MKSRYWNKRSPDDGPWDTIVIGSGMGGMTTAAMLSKLGHRVLVLEQHYLPGGFTHAFKRKGWSWDVGVHAVGEVTEHSMTGRLLSRLTDGRLEWEPLGENYDEFHYPDGVRIDFPNTPQKFRQNLIDAFPEETEAIDAYLARVRATAKAMKGYYLSKAAPRMLQGVADVLLGRLGRKAFSERTADVVNALTDNEQLRSVFTAQFGYYGYVPTRSSFAIQALVVKHFLHGGYYPVGGSERIAVELLRTVAECGGWTRIQADVEEILVENGRATGVRLATGEELRAKRIVSAAGIPSTVRRLLPKRYEGAEWVRSILSLKPSSAHVCLYLGFEGDIREAGCSSANKWFYSVWDCEQDNWQVDVQGELPDAPILYTSFPSLKDPNHDPGDKLKHTGEVVTFVPWKTFEPWRDRRWKRRGEDYDAFKTKMETTLLEQLLGHLPKLRPMVKYVELSTPLSTDHFCRPVGGSIYGLEPTVERFENPHLRPRSPIPGLYFSGSDVATVGVIGAFMGGVLAAMAIEPLKALKYVRG
jgi:all-trans-retinol 13,14-reductase